MSLTMGGNTTDNGIAPAPMDHISVKSAGQSSGDLEKQGSVQNGELQRKLSSRHLQFVAIGTSSPSLTGPRIS